MKILSTPPGNKIKKSKSIDNPELEEQLPAESNGTEQKTIEQETIVNEQEQDQAVNESDRLIEGGKDGFMD